MDYNKDRNTNVQGEQRETASQSKHTVRKKQIERHLYLAGQTVIFVTQWKTQFVFIY